MVNLRHASLQKMKSVYRGKKIITFVNLTLIYWIVKQLFHTLTKLVLSNNTLCNRLGIHFLIIVLPYYRGTFFYLNFFYRYSMIFCKCLVKYIDLFFNITTYTYN